MDSKKSELKTHILNQILFNKMNKKFEESKNSNSYEEFFAQTQNKPLPDFLNNFKCLKGGSGVKDKTPAIEYGKVFKKFHENLKKHEKNFDFSSYEKVMEMDSDFTLFEEILLEKYQEISSEITKKKEILIKMRESIALSLNTIRRLQTEVINLMLNHII